ncbi:MAG TPA: reverse transcriptase domain-containing protein [Fusibacter sp.]|nr:reverse transcriptase domain-containing protein [Fusibacter sp.]
MKTDVSLVPIVFADMKLKATSQNQSSTVIKVLLDSGASATLVKSTWLPLLTVTDSNEVTCWETSAGTFETKQKALTQIILTELHESRTITCSAHVAPNLSKYDMIIGREVLSELGIILNFKEQTIEWDEAVIPMKPETATQATSFVIKESSSVDEATERIKKILDAKYEAADIKTIVSDCNHLSPNEQDGLYKLLMKYESLFDGSLGTWKGEEYNIELKPDATPYHARAFPIPKIHEQTLKLEVDRLCELGVLQKVNRSEWAAPTFIIPKKDGTVRFISDFRQLNLRIKRKPFPIPKIQDLLLKLEGFQHATSLDLNMGYYHIKLNPFSRSLCTIVLPWGKYEYQRLPMGLCNSPDIFQEKMSSLMEDLEYCRAYIDDLLILSKGSWDQHLQNLETVLERLQQAGLKVNAKKSFFGKPELEYLGYWITRDGIQPVTKKVQAILQLEPPKPRRELRKFIGMINYYRDMWIRRSDVLAPLTQLVSKTAKREWTDLQQKAFETMKMIMSKKTLFSYPDFSQPSELHTDASKT